MPKKSNLDNSLDEKKVLEKLKLQLEIKHLNQSYFKRLIAPILIQAGIGLAIAVTSIYLAFKSNIFDVREKNIDAKTKYNEIVLKTIEVSQTKEQLAKEKDSIYEEISSIEIQKSKLLKDSILLSDKLDSLIEETLVLSSEKKSLSLNILNLTKTKSTLEIELGFSPINKDLQNLKNLPGPTHRSVLDIIHVLHSHNSYQKRAMDSLISYSSDEDLNYISFYILYKGTKAPFYRDQLFNKLISALIKPRKDTCFNYNLTEYIVDPSWTSIEKGLLSEMMLKQYNNVISNCVKEDILYMISLYATDSSFSLLNSNYSLFWDYLKYNRDLFTSTDTLVDKYSAIMNIAVYCPQLYFALFLKYFANQESTSSETMSCIFALIKSTTSFNELPYLKWNQLYKFGIKYNIFIENVSPNEQHYKEIYSKLKPKLDKWLLGYFDTFRHNKELYIKCMREEEF